MSAVRKTFSDQVGKRTNLTDMAGGTTKDTNDTKSAVHRLASSCSSSSSSSVVLTSRNTCEAAGRNPSATWSSYTIAGAADGRFVDPSDALGSVAAITDELQATVRTYTYEAFGKLRATTGTGPVGGNRFTYTGREPLDDSQSLYYYRWRVMDPNVGRFTSEDPLGFVDGVNVYVYVLNTAPNFSDPTGLAMVGTGIKKCKKTSPASGFPHGWIEYNGTSSGFYPGGATGGSSGNSCGYGGLFGVPGEVHTPDEASFGPKVCQDILLDNCKYDISIFKICVASTAPTATMNYWLLGQSCYNWVSGVISACKDAAKLP